MWAEQTLVKRVRTLAGGAVAIYVSLAVGCATERPFKRRPASAGASGMAGASGSKGSAGSGAGGRGGRPDTNTGGRPDASGGANDQGGEGGELGHAPLCEKGTFRCQGNVPEECTGDAWLASAPCTGATSVCVAGTGECTRAPKSAVEIVAGAAHVSGGSLSAEVQLGSGVAPTWVSGGNYHLYGSAVIDPSSSKTP
jgi:hypothetical protein